MNEKKEITCRETLEFTKQEEERMSKIAKDQNISIDVLIRGAVQKYLENVEKPQTMKEPKILSEQFAKCPQCGQGIIITWGPASVLTLNQYQQEVKRILKTMDEEEKKDENRI